MSTRPASSSIGTDEQWAAAEAALRGALAVSGKAFEVKEGDGAFYGPKIDVMVSDSVGRSHQTATVQLDFQLPIRFGLEYHDGKSGGVIGGGESGGGEVERIISTHADNKSVDVARPVMIHRAALGSVERMMGILIEHFGGRWPFWLSPRQAVVIPATSSPKVVKYASWVGWILGLAGQGDSARACGNLAAVRELAEAGVGPEDPGAIGLVTEGASLSPATPGGRFHYVDVRVQDVDASLAKRVRDAWVMRYNFIVIVGEREVEAGNITVRWTPPGENNGEKTQTMDILNLLDMWKRLERDFQ